MPPLTFKAQVSGSEHTCGCTDTHHLKESCARGLQTAGKYNAGHINHFESSDELSNVGRCAGASGGPQTSEQPDQRGHAFCREDL